MKFTLNNFYSNNYKDFIHLEALKNILRKVPELNLAGLENIENVLSMEFSVDDWGENPMYIKYVDTDGKEHIVKIRPAVTEQIYEILKAYAKISYVDEQDQKLKDELHTEITQGDENALNLSKVYTDTVVNHAKDEINHTIETTKQDLKGYCDNKCEITLASSKEYTDTKAHELSQRIDDCTTSLNGKIETTNQQVASNKEAIANNSNRIDTANQLITANDNKTTQALADVNTRIDNIPRASEVTRRGGKFKGRLNVETDAPNDFYSTVFLEQRDGSESESVGRLVKGDVAKKSDLDALNGKIETTNQQVASNKEAIANNSNRIDTANQLITANDNKTTQALADVNGKIDNQVNSLNGKVEATNQQVASNKEAIANNSNRIDTANQLITANDKKTTQALADVNGRIDDLPRSSEVTRKGGVFKERLNIETDNPNDFYSTVTLEQRDGTESEVVGRLVKGDVAKKAELDALSGKVTDLSSAKDNLNGKFETISQQVAINKGNIANNSNRIDTATQLITANDNKTTQALTDVNGKIDGLTIGATNLLSKTSTKEISIDAPTTEWSEGADYKTTRPLIEHEYVLSFEARGDIDEQTIGTFLWAGGLGGGNIVNSSVSSGGHTSTATDGRTFVTLTTSWKKHWVKYKVTPDNTKKSVIVGRRWLNSNPSGKVYVRNVKLEEGNKATSWSPAPEDTSDELSSINGKIETTNQQVTSNKEAIANNSNRIDTANQLITANDKKTTQALADVNGKIDNQVNSLNGKVEATNQQVASNKEAIANNSNRIDTANQLITANDNKTTQALADVNTRIDNIPRASEVTRKGGKFKGRLNVETDTPNDFYSTVFLEQRDGSESESVGRLVKGDVAKKADLDLLSGKVTGVDELKTNVTNLLSWKTNVNEVIKKVDDLYIGGTNFLWGTDIYVNNFWTLPVRNGISHGEREDDGLLSQSIHFWGDDIKAKELMATYWLPIHLIAGHQYTISLQARYYEPNRADTKVTGRNIRVFSDYTDAHEPEGFGLTTELTGEYKRYSHTFTCKQTGDYRGWRFGDWTDVIGYPGGSIFIGEIKIEEGNIPTAWSTAEGDLTSRLRGAVENVPKEFFMSLNNTVLDTNSCYARLFKFTDFAIVKIGCHIKGVTIEPWTYRDVVSAPQAYFEDFSKFDYIKGKKEFSDLGRPYDADFNISNSKIGIYCRGTKIENEDLFLEIAGILYN